MGMRQYLIVVLICITLIINDTEPFSSVCWTFVSLLWRNVYSSPLFIFIYFLTLFIYSYLEREEGRKKEMQRNMDVREKDLLVASRMSPDQDQSCNLGMSQNQESNPRPLTLRDDGQPTEPHWSGPLFILIRLFIFVVE